MKTMKLTFGALLLSITLAAIIGCEDGGFLTRQQDVDRPDLPEKALPVSTERSVRVEGDNGLTKRTNGEVVIKPPEEEVTGMYEFTTPTTVTRVDKVQGDYEQYLLYWGRPTEGDTPFIVLTVGPKLEVKSEEAGSNFKAEGNRIYRLNGLVAKEWTGYTEKRLPFCELVLTHEGKGNECHVVAVVKDEGQRKVALEVLGSLRWQANR